MGALLIVRHGQAASLDYDRDGDRLSPLGVEQARRLGERWVTDGIRPTRVFVGPRRRHRETFEAVRAVYRERAVAWPEHASLEALDEYPAGPILTRGLAVAIEREPALAAAAVAFAETRDTGSREFLQLFQSVTRLWMRGELAEVLEAIESWSAFRARVAAGLRAMTTGADRAATVAAFTSGGAVAASAGHALAASDDVVLELSWVVRNTSVTEILFSGERLTLAGFNGVPHLTDRTTITVR